MDFESITLTTRSHCRGNLKAALPVAQSKKKSVISDTKNKQSDSKQHTFGKHQKIDLKFVSSVYSQTNQRVHHGSDGERRASPHRLMVRTPRRGRDNPGSTPGEDIFLT